MGGILTQTTTSTTTQGYQQLLDVALAEVPAAASGRSTGVGSYGAGRARPRRAGRGGRPSKRPARRTGAKTDAVRAARQALGHQHLALPRHRGDHQALRVLLGCRRNAVTARVVAINQPQGADRRRL